MAGIKIALVEDVKSFLTGMKKSEDATDKFADSLDDLSRGGDDALDKLERSFRDVQQAGSKAGKDVGDDLNRGFDKAGEGAQEFEREAASTARESAASFDGSAESIGDAFQEVAANAFAGFGPAGAAAGLAAAVGLGIALQALTSADEKAREVYETSKELASTLRETGGDEAALADTLNSRWEEFAAILTNSGAGIKGLIGEEMTTAVDQIVTLLDAGTISAKQLDAAFRGQTGEARIRGLASVINDLAEADQKVIRSNQGLTPSQARVHTATVQLRGEFEKLLTQEEQANALNRALAESAGMTVDAYLNQVAATEKAAAVQEAYGDAIASAGEPVGVYEGILDRKNTAEQNAAQATADATEDATDSWEDYAKDVSVTVTDLIGEWERQAAAAQTFNDNLAIIAAAGGQALADELRAQGPEVAGAVADVLAHAGPTEQRDAIAAHANATGAEVGRGISTGLSSQQQTFSDAVNGFVAGIPVPSLTVPVKVDHAQAEKDLRDWINRGRSTVKVGVQHVPQAV